MNLTLIIVATTTLLAAVFSVALFDQWHERRHSYQLIWALASLFYAIGAGCEAIAEVAGWSEPVYKMWYLTGAVWTAGWFGLGTAFLLGRTRFGYTFAFLLFLAGLFTFLTPRRNPQAWGDVGLVPLVYFIVAVGLALAVAIETYFADWRWPLMALAAVLGATLLSIVLMATATLPPPGYAVDPTTGAPTGSILPGSLRLLTPFLNITGSLTLVLGAMFSAYVFMPKRRVLDYSLDATQPGEQFLFNLVISPVAIIVNFVASTPAAWRAFRAGELNTRVPATVLIALGGIVLIVADGLNRFGSTEFYQLGKLLGIALLFGGFLVSAETFHEIRVPFTSIVLRGRTGGSGGAARP